MKKALSLILALVMCLSLCACGENDATNQDNTTTNNISDNLDTSNSTTDASGADEDPLAFLYGNWIKTCQHGIRDITIEAPGTVRNLGGTGRAILKNDTLEISGTPAEGVYSIVSANDTHYLINDSAIYVREDDVGTVPVKQIQITAENWKDYIEVVVQANEKKDMFGDIVSVDMLSFFSLKKEYLLRKFGSDQILIRCRVNGIEHDIEVSMSLCMGIYGTTLYEEITSTDQIEIVRIEGTLTLLDGI